MQVSDFEFELPEHLIAKHPAAERTSSRLLHLHADLTAPQVTHHTFAERLMITLHNKLVPTT